MELVLEANGASFDFAGRYIQGSHSSNNYKSSDLLVAIPDLLAN